LGLSPLFFTVTATSEIYPLSLHDALPISLVRWRHDQRLDVGATGGVHGRLLAEVGHLLRGALLVGWQHILGAVPEPVRPALQERSEEHTSELQSRENLVCRLLLEKKKQRT